MQTVFCREGDCVQLPLRVIRKTNGSRHGQKAGLTMSNSPTTQTISLSVLKSLPKAVTFPNHPSEVSCSQSPSRQKSFCNRGCFLVASEGKLMNKQAEGNQRRGRKVLQYTTPSSCAVLHGQCVFIPGALLKASQNKNEESGEGWKFPKEILPDLDSSFLWSIMSAGGSITLLPP